jgi:hypothetical protein
MKTVRCTNKKCHVHTCHHYQWHEHDDGCKEEVCSTTRISVKCTRKIAETLEEIVEEIVEQARGG